MSFHVGQRVICVRAVYPALAEHYSYIKNWPVKDTIYTIRAIEADGDLVGVRLHEIVNPPTLTTQGVCEPGFTGEWFRPLTERKTDISVFTEILDRENDKRRIKPPAEVS